MAKNIKPVARARTTEKVGRIGNATLDAVADSQQRLLDAQASIEREAARTRELETRYRYLLATASDGVVMVDAERRRIIDANPAAAERLGVAVSNLLGSPVRGIVAPGSEAALTKRLEGLLAGTDADRFSITLPDGSTTQASAALFRQDGVPVFMVQFGGLQHAKPSVREGHLDRRFNDFFTASPDAIVLADRSGNIVQANPAFLDLVQVATERQARGASLARWLGRTSVDLGVLISNIRQRGRLKLFSTHLRAEHGALTEVEISAMAIGDEGLLGFSIRDVGRRLPSGSHERADLPRSVSQLTELVGRLPMKDIVGNTADLIEQMCIRAALELTRDNRVAAAELLGLSRQSLYVKLRRYNMVDGVQDDA
jgi:transcriptional regulator PpsR